MPDLVSHVTSGPGTSAAATVARASARRAADQAGVVVRRLDTLDDARAAGNLFNAVWRPADGHPPFGADLIRAVVGADGYAVGAFVGQTMVGACVGFWASPEAQLLHSHITGVASDHRARHVGYAIKLDQRAYTLEHSADTITWTFDPLVRRNAHFNLRRLGARPVAYHVNYYGEMIDGVNGVDETDRFLVRWDLFGDTTRRACDLESSEPAAIPSVPAPLIIADGSGAPLLLDRTDARLVTIAIPPDIERVRQEDPGLAHRWREATRMVFTDLFARGGRVLDLDHGHYVAERGDE
jgi:predicted GNAT superfamily acetyltransferase